MEKQETNKRKKSPYQDFVIRTQPTLVNKERVKPSKGSVILEATDEIYKVKRGHLMDSVAIMGGAAALFGIWLLRFDDITFWEYVFIYFLILIGLFFVVFAFTVDRSKKVFILDRLNGTVTYPDMFYAPPLKGNFKDLKAVISVSGSVDGAPMREYLKFVNTFKPRKLDVLRTITYKNPYEEWSLYVWYMDKNRPLPPGTAFDPYREKDFERRKKEGFPRPLFMSHFETPESTPEQQKIRKKIGRW